ncbi:hypothetical protein L5515_006835 [Caenorhabditis briggsae]|uniref:Uncharacterized protein n=1 Tax=Caenorhabditis briggsae TaxID=6238 RepID=A0AAE9JJ99_CAEBR|nr:hypothetical protein L5515_006835 [Caenorhabditis briggsae]
MNRQFFRTLTFQTLFSFFTYSQVGLLLLFPVFEVHVAGMANSASACVAVYPCDKRRKVNSCTTDGFSAHGPL